MVSASCGSGTLPWVTRGVGAGGGLGASAAACSSSRSMSSCFLPLTFRPRSLRRSLRSATFSAARSHPRHRLATQYFDDKLSELKKKEEDEK